MSSKVKRFQSGAQKRQKIKKQKLEQSASSCFGDNQFFQLTPKQSGRGRGLENAEQEESDVSGSDLYSEDKSTHVMIF